MASILSFALGGWTRVNKEAIAMVIKKKRNAVNTTFDQEEKDESCLDLERVNSYTSESKEAIALIDQNI